MHRWTVGDPTTQNLSKISEIWQVETIIRRVIISYSCPSDISQRQFVRILPLLESACRRTKPRTVVSRKVVRKFVNLSVLSGRSRLRDLHLRQCLADARSLWRFQSHAPKGIHDSRDCKPDRGHGLAIVGNFNGIGCHNFGLGRQRRVVLLLAPVSELSQLAGIVLASVLGLCAL